METKKIDLSIEEARALYKSGNLQFKKLALSAFTESELTEVTYTEMANSVVKNIRHYLIPREYLFSFDILVKLSIIAKFYNQDWKRTCYNTGYFITPVSVTINGKRTYQFGVRSHCNVVHPGIIYFKRQEEALRAIKILNLDKYLDSKTCRIENLSECS